MSDGDKSITKTDDALERHLCSIRARMQAHLGDELYDSWFKRLDVLSVDDEEVTLAVPTRFIKAWIERYHLRRLETEFRAEFGEIRRISLRDRPRAA